MLFEIMTINNNSVSYNLIERIKKELKTFCSIQFQPLLRLPIIAVNFEFAISNTLFFFLDWKSWTKALFYFFYSKGRVTQKWIFSCLYSIIFQTCMILSLQCKSRTVFVNTIGVQNNIALHWLSWWKKKNLCASYRSKKA